MWIGYNAKRICSTFTCAVLQKQHQTLLIIVEWPHVTSTWPGHVTSPAANQRNEESSREREKATVYSRQCQSESSSSTLHARWNEQERCRAVSDRESVSTSHRPRYLWPWPVTLTLNRRRAMVTTRTQAKDHCRRSVLLCSVLNISRRRLDVRNIQGG